MKARVAVLVCALTLLGLNIAPFAEAGENSGRVRNYSGNHVVIRCQYGNPATNHTLREGYPAKRGDSRTYCPSDTDQLYAYKDVRCIHYAGPGLTDGWYRLHAGKWRKVPGLVVIQVHSYTAKRCGSKPWYLKN